MSRQTQTRTRNCLAAGSGTNTAAGVRKGTDGDVAQMVARARQHDYKIVAEPKAIFLDELLWLAISLQDTAYFHNTTLVDELLLHTMNRDTTSNIPLI